MKSFKSGVLVSFAFLFLGQSLPTFAHGSFKPGYIRTLDDNIEYGYIEELAADQKYLICRFKEYPEDAVEEYRADQLTGYGFGYDVGEEFFARVVGHEGSASHMFLESLVPYGKLKLFTAWDNFYVSNNNSPAIELSREDFKQKLSDVLSGCPNIEHAIGALRFTKRSLVAIVKDYNSCVAQESASFSTNHSYDQRIKYSISAGVDFLQLQSPKGNYFQIGNSNNGLTTANPLKIGVYVTKSISRKLDIRTGILFSKRNFHKTTSSQYYSGTSELKIKFNEIQLPLIIQYNFLKKSTWGLYARSGITFSLINGVSATNRAEMIYVSGVAIPYLAVSESIPILDISKSPQINAGVGYSFNIANRRKLVYEVYGEWGHGKTKYHADLPDVYVRSEQEVTIHKSIVLLMSYVF